jgi:5-methylcytosine-specific restriction protein A
MTTRREFSAKVRRDAAKRAGGVCEGCGFWLRPGTYHYDHIVPDGLGGEPTLENCAVLCSHCHKIKTARRDNPIMQKADRQRKMAENRKVSRSPLPFGRGSPLKKKMDGSVVRRGQP